MVSRRRNLLAAIALAAVLIAALPAAASAAPSRYCGAIPDLGPTGRDPADAKDIRANRVGCREARGVARAWFRRFGEPVRFGPWTCRSTIRARQHVRCTASAGREVRFYLG